ncbi:MAG: caspase family protein [Algicola sp.]|nr:caspase family protein [Algicola sp.]
MGKKIALLIGIHHYDNESNLPPCQKDIALISEIISTSEKYDDWIALDQSPTSSEAKDKIAGFIRKYQEQDIDEVLFYYTGHGTRKNDDFLYLFSDFDKTKVEQTSLRNSEFDSMLKSLNPKLAVKIVDACQAGTEYIKSNQDLKMIFEKSSTDSFDKTYFLFSSSNTESSIALQDYSVFTKSFAKSLVNFQGKDIRYRDIMAYISDDSSVTKHQTPLFILQANNTEIFCSVSDSLANNLAQKLDANTLLEEDSKSNESTTANQLQPAVSLDDKLIQSIKRKSQEYCSKEDAQNSLTFLNEQLNAHDWSSLISSLYEIKYLDNYAIELLDCLDGIAKWIQDSDELYFAEMTYKEVEYQGKEKIEYETRGIMTGFSRESRVEYKPATLYKDVISGFELTASAPNRLTMITLKPAEEILPWYTVFFTFVFSKSKLTLFFKYEIEKELNWSERKLQNQNQWQIVHCNLKSQDAINTLVRDSFTDIENSITEEIRASFED